MATELNHSDGDRLVETRRPLDELNVELKDLGGDCIKVMQLLTLDSSLLKDRALAVLHLGVSRGCIEIVEQVVKFYEGDDSLGGKSERGSEKDEQQTTRATEDGSKASSGDKGEDILRERSETDQQGVKASREEEIDALSGNKDAPTVALDQLQTQIDDKNENSDPDPSHSQDDLIRETAAGKGTSRHSSDLLDFVDVIVKEYAAYGGIDERPVLDFAGLLKEQFLYSGPARKLTALKVAVINGNLDVLALLLTKTPSASRIGPKTRSVALHELRRNRLREIMEQFVESIRGHSVSLKIYQSVFEAWRDDPEFNFLFWDFGLGQERVSEYLFHFLFTKRVQDSFSWRILLRLTVYLWGKVWDYKGGPWEEPLWKSLLKLHDAQGRTPLHVAVDEDTVGDFKLLLDELRLADRVEVFAFAMEATDGLGRTPWHRAVLQEDAASARDLSSLHEDLADECRGDKVDAPGIYDRKKNEKSYGRLWKHPMENPVSRLDSRGIPDLSWPGAALDNGISRGRTLSKTTPVHSALMHRRDRPWYSDGVSYGSSTFSPRDTPFRCWVKGFHSCDIDALELATITSNVHVVKQLLTSAEEGPLKTAYTSKQSSEWGTKNRYGWVVGDKKKDDEDLYLPCPTIHIAAYSGNYEMLKVFINSNICDPYIEDEDGCTILHVVLDPKTISIKGDLNDFANVKHIPPNYEGSLPYESSIVERQGCINLLLQSGLDIFKVDKNGQAPYPKGRLSKEKDFLSWWYDRQLKEFTANQSAMSFATNAISVMATLVATASYVGPLQPPLGYSSGDGPNQIQTKYMWVRIFVVCDTLSFYLAIAAITYSLIPSLPMPQQPMAAELQKTRGMIIAAVIALFPSIVCILLAFAASSIVVVSANGRSSVGGKLTTITAFTGGGSCLIGFFLLLIRLLGILFPRVHGIRRLYDATSFLFEGKGMAYLIATSVNRIRSRLTHYGRQCFKH